MSVGRKRNLTDVLYILFLSWVVIYADFHLTKHNLGAEWNGVGAIPSVLAGTAKSPMQYRVLIPWLCGWLTKWLRATDDRLPYFNIYLWIKWIGVVAAIGGAFWYFSGVTEPYIATTLFAVFLVWAALYDYADAYWEMAFLAVAFGSVGQEYMLLVASLVAFVGALNRETAVLIPMVLFLSGAVQESVIVMAFFVMGLYLPIQFYGKRERYCPWIMIRSNIEVLKKTLGTGKPFFLNEYGMFFGLFLTTICLYLYSYMRGVLSPIDTALGIFFVGMLVPSMWREIRVFAPVTLALIPMVVRGLVS